MKAVMQIDHFHDIVKATCKFIYIGVHRPMLEYIRLDFDKDTLLVKAYASDGYRVSTETRPCYEIDESFMTYIKPFGLHDSSGIYKVDPRNPYMSVELVDKRCLLSIGERIIGTRQPEGDPVNFEGIIATLKESKVVKEVKANPFFLVDAIKSVKVEYRQPVHMQFTDGHGPIIIKTKTGARYILPCRND